MEAHLIVAVSRNVSVCRICLNVCDRSQNILLADAKWSEMYEFCCGIAVTTDDATKLLCRNCQLSLEQNAEFKRKCLRSNSLLTSFVRREESKLDEEGLKDECDNKDTDIFEKIIKPEQVDKDQIDTSQPANFQEICNEQKLTNITFKIENEEFECDDVDPCNDENVTIDINIDQNNDAKIKIANNIIKVTNQIENYTEINAKKKTKVTQKGKSSPTKKRKRKVKRVQNGDYFTNCGLCEFKSDKVAVKEHLQSHIDGNELTCQLCSFVGGELAEIAVHRYAHITKPDQKTGYRCHVCNILRRKLMTLEWHYKVVHFSNGDVVCNVCKAQLKDYQTYRYHAEIGHGEQIYTCDHCGKSFGNKKSLVTHLQIVAGAKNTYFCEKCGKSFSKLYNYKMHVLSWHTVSRPVKCQHCSKMYKNQTTLDQHLKRLVTRYTCDVCSKKFAKLSAMNKHKIWHSELKPFKCENCGSAFKMKSHLKVHVRSHTGDIPFKCNECDHGFSTSSVLKRHLSVHTGVRRHKCNLCERSFNHKQLLRKHCEKAHNAKDED